MPLPAYTNATAGYCVSFVPYSTARIDDIVTRLQNSGANCVRTDMLWPHWQPTNPSGATVGLNDTLSSNVSTYYDYYLNALNTAGIKLLAVCAYTPDWAHDAYPTNPNDADYENSHIMPTRSLSGNTRDSTYNPDFANFMWLVADHIEGTWPGLLMGLEVWNEPNLLPFFACPPDVALYNVGGANQPDYSPDPRRYAEMVQGAWNAVKLGQVSGRPDRTAYPDIPIIAGGSAAGGAGNSPDSGGTFKASHFDRLWFEWEGADNFDHLAWHPYHWGYTMGLNVNWNHLLNAATEGWPLLKEYGRSDAQIWNTEWGVPSRTVAAGTGQNGTYKSGWGGWQTIPPAGHPGQYRTSNNALDVNRAAEQITDHYAFWRGTTFYDNTLNVQFSGPSWYYLAGDLADGWESDWGATNPHWNYFGAYEYGTHQYNGTRKTAVADAVEAGFAQTDVTVPACILALPAATFAVVSGSADLTDILVAATDNDQISAVALWVDGAPAAAVPQVSGDGWYYTRVNLGTYSVGAHSLVALAADMSGNSTWSATRTFTVTAPVAATAGGTAGYALDAYGELTFAGGEPASATDSTGDTFPTLRLDLDERPPRSALDPLWRPVVGCVRSMSIVRGKADESADWDAGTCEIVLRNDDRTFDPTNTASDYYGLLTPNRRFRVTATFDAVDYILFDGYADTWEQVPGDQANNYAECVLRGTDLFKLLSRTKMSAHDGLILDSGTDGILDQSRLAGRFELVEQQASSRFTDILDSTGYQSGVYSADTTATTLMYDEPDVTGDVLTYLRRVAASVGGDLLVAQDGRLVLWDRYHWSEETDQYVTTGEWSDDGTGLRFAAVTLLPADMRTVSNIVVRGREDGAEFTRRSRASISAYGASEDSRTDLLTLDKNELASQAEAHLARNVDPRPRVAEMVIVPRRDPATLFPQVLGRELLDKFSLARTVAGVGAAYDADYQLIRVEHTVGPLEWSTVWSGQVAVSQDLFRLDRSVLDGSAPLAY